MKLTIKTPNGVVKNVEVNDQEKIKIFLKRGWKEVLSDKPTVKAKKKPKKKGKK